MAKRAKAGGGDKYLTCLLENMATARFGPERIAAAKDAYARMADGYVEAGMGLDDARSASMNDMIKRIQEKALEKQDRVIATTKKLGEMRERLVEAHSEPVTKFFNRSEAARSYDAYHATLEDVPHLKTARGNFTAEKDVAVGNMFSMLRGVMDDFSKNWLGMNRGHVDTAEIVNAMRGATKNVSQTAKDVATALQKIYKYAASELGMDGVKVSQQLDDPAVFQPNKAKLEAMGEKNFVELAQKHTDWNRSGNGHFIRANERDEFLKSYFYAHVNEMWGESQFDTNPKLKGIPRPYEFTGGQFARDFQNYTILKFKDGAAYAEMHSKLMDGNFLDTTTRMVEKLGHNIALAKVFGPSPQYTAAAFKKMAEDAVKTYKRPGEPISNWNRFERRAKNLTDIAFKQNPLDGESRLGMFVQTTTNLMNTAMLNGALISSIPGDFMTVVANRLANHEPVIGALGQYFKDFLSTKTARRDALGMGHIYSEFLGQITQSTHYHSGFAMGEHITKVLADKTMKLNLMNRHFDAMVIADTKYRAFTLFEDRHLSYDATRMKTVLENNGITPAEWDKTRKVMDQNPFQPADDISMFRPLDHRAALGDELVNKWQRLFWNESRKSVMRSSMEAQAIAMGDSRIDSFVGVLRKSTIAFQTYGITFGMALGRAIMHGTPGERMSAFARMGVGGIIAGAVAAQAKNLWYGKQMEPMDSTNFWLKAVANGALGPWGSVVTGGMRTDSASAVIKAASGPYLQFLADAYQVGAGSAFQYLDMSEGNQKFLASKKGILFIDFLRKYMIPQTFWSTLALQRHVLEPLQEQFNASAMKKRYKAQAAHAKGIGTDFRKGYEPGSGTGSLPGLGGIL